MSCSSQLPRLYARCGGAHCQSDSNPCCYNTACSLPWVKGEGCPSTPSLGHSRHTCVLLGCSSHSWGGCPSSPLERQSRKRRCRTPWPPGWVLVIPAPQPQSPKPARGSHSSTLSTCFFFFPIFIIVALPRCINFRFTAK